MDQPISPTPDTNDLQQELADLRRRTIVLYVALAVLSFTLAGFIGLQKHRNSNDLENYRPHAMALIDAHRKKADTLGRFVSQLEAYGRTHPDFQLRVLSRYQQKSNAAPSSASATVPR